MHVKDNFSIANTTLRGKRYLSNSNIFVKLRVHNNSIVLLYSDFPRN